MLSNILNTNEVKNAAGTEVEFQHLRANEREREFGLITESPALLHRLMIKHNETGVGIKRRRRSLIRCDKNVMSTVDTTLPCFVSAYTVLDIPVGALLAYTEASNVLAELGSFTFTLGTSTFLYDGTGNGAGLLLTGGLGN